MIRSSVRHLSILLCITLMIQSLTGCANVSSGRTGEVIVDQEFINQNYVSETFITEEQLTETYIIEHLLYEDGIYEYRIAEQTIGQVMIIELVVGEHSEDELESMLPEELQDYDIEWGKVIGKFAVGTTVIIAVGVVNGYMKSKGINPTFFMMCSTSQVLKEALVGGAISAALNVTINSTDEEEMPNVALKKYAIEGYADGYMWGAISAVLKVNTENIKRLDSLKLALGEKVSINSAGQVFDDAGKLIGRAFYDKNGIWHLVNESTKRVSFFDKKGKQIVDAAELALYGLKNGQLPANSILKLAAEGVDDVLLHYTDDVGQIYRVGKKLLPNTTYKLKGYTYSTDSMGRPIKVTFDKLRLKPDGRKRLDIVDSLYDISRGFGKDGLDDRGHLIGDQFDGDNTLANIVAMDKYVNQQTVKKIETLWAKTLQDGGKVSGSIEITYSGSSYRPDGFKYVYDIGSGLVEEIISNVL